MMTGVLSNDGGQWLSYEGVQNAKSS